MPYITIQKTKIYYKITGEGYPLIFLHGTFLDSSAYSKVIKLLSKKYKVYAFDYPMHGRSESRKDHFTMREFSSVLKEFTEKHNINNPILCAHSGGCILAIIYASKYKVKELVLLAPAGLKYFNSMNEFLFRMFIIKTPMTFFVNPINAIVMNYKGGYAILKKLFKKEYWKSIIHELKHDYINEMKKIKCPVYLLWNKNDEILPYKYSKQFLKHIKNAKLITVKGRHDWPILKPKEINKYLNL